MRNWLLLSLALALALAPVILWSSGRGNAEGGPTPPLVEGAGISGKSGITADHIVVRFKPGVSEAMARSVHTARGAAVLKKQPRSGLQRIAVPAGVSVEQMLATYRANPLVAEASVGRIATILDTPNDTNYLYQWHMHNSEGGMWADLGWNLAPNRGANVTVAVIDSGVAFEDYTTTLDGYTQTFKVAPDLASTTFVAPWDFNQNDAHPNDDNGHGTHVAGTIAQNTNNAYGAAGVAYNARIMPVKVLDYTGNGFDDDIVEGIYHAVDNGADVINMSIGFPGSGGGAVPCSEFAGLNAALDYAHAQGVVLVAAAGNDGGIVSCPAAHPAVIAVGAAGYDGKATWYSNNGAALDISAPGGDPLVDLSGDGYADGVLQETFCYDASVLLILDLYGSFCNVFNAGTSMASPHVAGTAALLLGEDPSLTPDEVRGFLEGTARERGAPGWDPNYGWGALDSAGALAAMLGVPKPEPTPVPGLDAPTNLTATAVSSSRINLAWTDNATAETQYRIERSTDGVNFTQVAILPANSTSWPNQSLPASTTYHYRVRASGGPMQSPYSNVATATTQATPAAPANLTATAVSSSRINLTWTDNAANEIGFKIERSTDGSNFALAGIVGANATSFVNFNLTSSTLFFFRVRAYDGPNHSAYSNTASATTQPTPVAPSNLAATAVSSSQVNLTWKDNATNETGFKLERSTDGVNFTQTNFLSKDAVKFSVSGLAAGTTYHFRLRAYDGPNHSAYSNVAAAATLGHSTPTATATASPTPAPTATPTPVPAPSDLVATAVSSSRINVTWTDNSDSEDGFKLERTADGVTWLQAATLLTNQTSFANTNLTANTTYTYRVRAFDGTNYSAYSNLASATTQPPPAAPSNLTATAVSTSRIDVAWTDNATNEGGFKIERSTDGVSFSQIATLPANYQSYSNTGLSEGTTYWYRVRAYDGPNHSGYSNAASATPSSNPTATPAPTASPSPSPSPSPTPSPALSPTASPSPAPSPSPSPAPSPPPAPSPSPTPTPSPSPTPTPSPSPAPTPAPTASPTPTPTPTPSPSISPSPTPTSSPSPTPTPTATPTPTPTATPTPTPSSAPSNLTATAVSSSRIDLAWTDNSTNEIWFTIERSTDGVSFTLVATAGANQVAYSSTSLAANTTYTYRVRAYDGATYSAYSNTASAATLAPPDAPSDLRATATSKGRIAVRWTDNATYETGFKLERSTDGVNFAQIALLPANSTAYSNGGLTSGVTYHYRVRAYEGQNHSAYSSIDAAVAK